MTSRRRSLPRLVRRSLAPKDLGEGNRIEAACDANKKELRRTVGKKNAKFLEEENEFNPLPRKRNPVKRGGGKSKAQRKGGSFHTVPDFRGRAGRTRGLDTSRALVGELDKKKEEPLRFSGRIVTKLLTGARHVTQACRALSGGKRKVLLGERIVV